MVSELDCLTSCRAVIWALHDNLHAGGGSLAPWLPGSLVSIRLVQWDKAGATWLYLTDVARWPTLSSRVSHGVHLSCIGGGN